MVEGEQNYDIHQVVDYIIHYAAQLLVSSVLQGGTSPTFLADWVYQYISGGLNTVSIQKEEAAYFMC